MHRLLADSPEFAPALLAWFDAHQRDLPWRNSRDAYRIWVSEVMLQQTQVRTVIPYFERFLIQFPTVTALAEADEQTVLRHWEGLGYYRRARHLHAAAKQLVASHPDTLPNDPAIWSDLPGVGRYILGAVLSQAFDRRLPIVEANTLRVLCRLFGYTDDPRSTIGKRWLWETAERILPMTRVGDFNQAMMELGALICSPDQPRCDVCPVAEFCQSKRDGSQSRIPLAASGPKIESVREIALVIERDGEVLLTQRTEQGRWSLMWEFPRIAIEASESVDQAAARILQDLGITATLVQPFLEIRHGVTRYAIHLTGWRAIYQSGEWKAGNYQAGRWLKPEQLGEFPVSVPQRKLIKHIVQGVSQGRLFPEMDAQA